jgi:hypothetical protein
MKKINKNWAVKNFQPVVFFAGAGIFMLLLFGFNRQQSRVEKLLGVSFNYDKKEITIQAVSTGCTVKNDFQFKVSNNNITIIRKKRDECKMMPGMASFTYSFLESGLSPDKTYLIKNKFIANPNLANIP